MVSMPRKSILDIDMGRRHQLQYQFLEVTNRVCPEVAADLKNVLAGESTFREFVEHYPVRGTWLERAARSTLSAWGDNQAFAEESHWRLPSTAEDHDYGYPPFTKTRQLMQTFYPLNYLYNPDAVKRAFDAAVGEDLETIRQWAIEQGYMVVKRVPRELTRNLECASLYLFRGRTHDQLTQEHYATDRNNTWRGIRDVFALLDLPLRGRGHGAPKNLKKRKP